MESGPLSWARIQLWLMLTVKVQIPKGFIKREIENLDKDLAIIDERFQAMGIGTNVELYAGQGSFTDKKVAPLQKTKKS